MSNIKTPRNGITIADKIPQRWRFLQIHRGYQYTINMLCGRIDTVAEIADALSTGNGISPEAAVEHAIKDLIEAERNSPPYSTGDYWILTPTHRKAIVKWIKAT
jgi:hypothetical protein